MIKRLAEKLYRGDQSWHCDSIYEITNHAAGVPPQKAEVRICRNAYDFQSYGRASLFSLTDLRWNVVATTIGQKLKCLGISYTEKDELVIIRDHMKAIRLDEETLMREVCLILGVSHKETICAK
jgi:hypothetical protein